MAIRLYSEFLSDQGTQYKIELHDSTWLGGAHEFECGDDGFTLNYSGETDDIISPIISSECEIGVAIRTGQVLNYFDALKTHQENRFRVVILKANSVPPPSQAFRERVEADGGSVEAMDCVQNAIEELGGDDYSIYWAGWVMQDLVTLEDTSEPYFMRLKAVDGIGRLANIDYTDTNDITQNGLGITRNNIVIYNCLEAIGTSDLWGSSVAFLETCVDWWEVTKMTYATTDDPLYLSGVDVGLFEINDKNGNSTRLTYFDVLRQMAVVWGCRVYLTEGRFMFEQVGARASASRYISQYDKTGTVIANPSVSDDITVDQTSGNARLAGNSFNFLPALKKVSVTYAQRFLSPWYGVQVFDESNSEVTVGFIAGGSGIQFSLYGPLSYVISSSTGDPGDDALGVSPVLRVQIRIEDSGNPGTYYYYNRAFNGYAATTTFGTAAWSTTAGYYYFDIAANSVSVGEVSFYELATISTTDIPVTGTLRVVVEKYNLYNIQTGAVYTLAAHQSEVWSAVFVFSRIDGGLEAASGEVYTATNSSTAIGSNLTLDLGEVYFADGALQTGYFVAYNSSTTEWETTSAWRKGNSGTGVPILKLMTREALALHTSPVERYNGKLLGAPSFQPRRQFDGRYWLFSGGRFVANYDEWDAEMFSIARSTTNITELTPVAQDRTPLLVRSGGSTPTDGPNELNAGKVGGMSVDAANQKIGPFQEVTTGGKVNGTLEATGNTTLDQKLLVDGGAVLGISGVGTSFQARVEADGGSVEALSCVSTSVYDLSVLGGNNVNILQDTSISETLSVVGQTTLKATAADFIDLSLTADADANVAGRLTWNDTEQTVRVGLSPDVTLNIGEDDKMFVRNVSGVTINKGTLVMSTGISGNKVTIAKAVTDGSVSPKYMVGVLAQTLLNNESGVAFWRGFINGIDTSAFSEGAVLWNNPSVAGALSSTEPTAPNLKMSVAIVTKSNASTGEIYCRPWLGNKLSEIHDVAESVSVASGDLIRRSSSGTYETFTPDYYSPAEGSAPTAGTEGSSPTIPYGTDNGNYLAEPDKWGRISIGGTNYVFPLFIEP